MWNLKTVRKVCGIVGAIFSGVMGIAGGYIAGSEAAPKVLKAKKIWDELNSEDDSPEDVTE